MKITPEQYDKIKIFSRFQALQYVCENSCQCRASPKKLATGTALIIVFVIGFGMAGSVKLKTNCDRKPLISKELRNSHWTASISKYTPAEPACPSEVSVRMPPSRGQSRGGFGCAKGGFARLREMGYIGKIAFLLCPPSLGAINATAKFERRTYLRRRRKTLPRPSQSYFRDLRQAAQNAPHGKIIAHADAFVVRHGRELLRISLENIVQEQNDLLEQKRHPATFLRTQTPASRIPEPSNINRSR